MEVYTIHFETVDSTNTWMKTHARTLDPSKLTCLIADIQTAGRGCYSKHWVSKKGNLTMSLFFHLPQNDPIIPKIAQLAAHSTLEVLRSENIDAVMKWPNDLLVNGKKLCGILAESIFLDHSMGIVVGIGLNVNVPVETDQPVTSLIELTGHAWDLSDLANKIIFQFLKDLG